MKKIKQKATDMKTIQTCTKFVKLEAECQYAIKTVPFFKYKTTIPRYTFPNRGTCVQLQSCDALLSATTKLKPDFSTVAYIGSQPEYYLSMIQKPKSLQEIIIMDASLDLLSRSHFNIQKLFPKMEKWFLLTQFDDWQHDENELDLIVVNNNINLMMSENLEETLKKMVRSLRASGVVVGSMSGQENLNEIRKAVEKIGGVRFDAEEKVLPAHYPNNLFVYSIVKY